MPLSAMNSRRTSFAPSNILLMRESRRIRSYGYGFTYPRPPASCTMSSAARHTISLANTFAQAASSEKSLSPRSTSEDRKSTRLNSSHSQISYAVFCLKKKKKKEIEVTVKIKKKKEKKKKRKKKKK